MSENEKVVTSSSQTNLDLVIKNKELGKMVTEEKGRNTTTMLAVIVGQGITITFLLWLAFVHFPQEKYVPNQNAAALCSVYALDEANVTNATAADFAAQAVVGIYSYTFQNYRQAALDVSDRFFSPKFRDSYLTAFGDSQNLKMVIQNFYQVYANTAGIPAIVKSTGVTPEGAFYWDVQVVVNVTFTSGRKIIPDRVLANVRVERVQPSRTAHQNGLAVTKITTESFAG